MEAVDSSSAGGSGDGVVDPDRERERARVRLAILLASACGEDEPTESALHAARMSKMSDCH